ncbi:hypothetical protein [Bradyrhizobium sp. ORS 86]|uniref:hypothetical protein n=1 Tax=Bradyrhizobium sp. ORS 86 TaxID=1685970 RepID=UPI00388E8A21
MAQAKQDDTQLAPQTAPAETSPYHLTVVNEFGNYTKGQRITDAAEVNAILASHNHTHVVKTAAS